jgi:hypothetical protein
LKEKNQKLLTSAETLETTAKITLNPEKAPRPEKKVEIKVIFKDPLDSLEGFSGTKGALELAEQGGRKVFKLKAPGAECARKALSVPENSMLRISCWIKGKQIKATRRNGGTRVGLFFKTNDNTYWPAAKALTGSFNWLKAFFKTSIPFGCHNITLLLGLAGAEGTVYIRDLSVEQIKER